MTFALFIYFTIKDNMENWKTTLTGLLGGSALWTHDALASGQVITRRGFLSFLVPAILGLVAGDAKKSNP